MFKRPKQMDRIYCLLINNKLLAKLFATKKQISKFIWIKNTIKNSNKKCIMSSRWFHEHILNAVLPIENIIAN